MVVLCGATTVTSILYMPRVVCDNDKCQNFRKPVDAQRRHEAKGNKRYVLARCHGIEMKFPFVGEADQEVKLG
jgi:hypothetical protein